MRRIAVLLWVGARCWSGVDWVARRSSRPPPAPTIRASPASRSTMEGKDLTVARRHFEPGARSAWHSHDKGQLLMVEEGRMRTQKRGQAVKELGVGESDYTGPNMVHWHGAAPGQALVQINVGFGGETKWLEKVTDAEYNRK